MKGEGPGAKGEMLVLGVGSIEGGKIKGSRKGRGRGVSREPTIELTTRRKKPRRELVGGRSKKTRRSELTSPFRVGRRSERSEAKGTVRFFFSSLS